MDTPVKLINTTARTLRESYYDTAASWKLLMSKSVPVLLECCDAAAALRRATPNPADAPCV
jgi:hypothetical protein